MVDLLANNDIMSSDGRMPVFGVETRSDIKWGVQSQSMARGLKLLI